MATAASTTVSLELTRVFNVPRDRVYAAWSSSEAMKQWFGPSTCNVVEADFEPKVGEQYRVKVNSSEMGDIDLAGSFREVSPPEKLVFTWQWLTEPMSQAGESLVTVEFVDLGTSTEIRLTHEGFPSDEARENHQEGWTSTLDSLQTYLLK